MGLPKPPIKTMPDFIVFCFISVVVIILLLATTGIILIAIFDPERDQSTAIKVLGNVLTTLVGALLGYLARKGSERTEQEKESKDE